MSRGKKLDLFIGAEIEDGWTQVESPRQSSLAREILEPQNHQLFFKKEKRRGKTVTLVGEFFLEDAQTTSLIKELKKKLGCGGTSKDGWMEFQGEIKDRLRELLVEKGFRFKAKH